MKKVIGGKLKVPLSPAIKTETLVFVSGQIAADSEGNFPDDIRKQTRIVLKKIESLLHESGISLKEVIKTTVFITDISDFQAMNEVYRTYFPVDPPARSCVRADLMKPGLKVEIEAIALS